MSNDLPCRLVVEDLVAGTWHCSTCGLQEIDQEEGCPYYTPPTDPVPDVVQFVPSMETTLVASPTEDVQPSTNARTWWHAVRPQRVRGQQHVVAKSWQLLGGRTWSLVLMTRMRRPEEKP